VCALSLLVWSPQSESGWLLQHLSDFVSAAGRMDHRSSFTSTAVGRKAFRYAVPTVWNSVPFNIRHSPSIGSFKRHLKTYLSPSPVSHVLHVATPAPPTRSSKLALYKSCNNNNHVIIITSYIHK